MKEIWKDIEEYEGIYQISNLGRIKSLARMDFLNHKRAERILKPGIAMGYLHVILYNRGTKRSFKVHRLVASGFILNSENKKEVNHINGIKDDNEVKNLEWVTKSENEKHAYATGLKKIISPPVYIGENHPRAHLSEKDIIKIREYLENGYFQKTLADLYNVTQSCISSIKLKKTWSHI